MASDGWISVADNLPAISKGAICANKHGYVFYAERSFMGDTWYSPSLERFVGDVTHWMPLPKPPGKPAEPEPPGPAPKARGKEGRGPHERHPG